MTNYTIKKDTKKKKIIEHKLPTCGYKMKPNFQKRKNMIDVKEIIIINPTFKKNLCQVKFNILFRRLTMIVLSVINDNDTEESDAFIALNDLKKAKALVVDEFAQFLSKQEVKNMLKKLMLLDKQLRDYVVRMNINQEVFYNLFANNEEKKGKSR